MSRILGTVCLMLLCQRTSTAGGNDPAGVVLVSASGQATLAGNTLTVGRKSTAQVLVQNAFMLGIAGPAKVQLRPGKGRIIKGGRLRLAGQGELELPDGWRVRIGGDGVAVLVDRDLWVLSGTATVWPPSLPAFPPAASAPVQPASAPASLPSTPSSQVVRAGHKARLGAGQGCEVTAATLGKRHAALGLSYEAPKTWAPALGQVGIMQAERAVQLVRDARQAAREMAACGCTEAGDNGASALSDRRSGTAMERRNATVRIRVRGVPPRQQ